MIPFSDLLAFSQRRLRVVSFTLRCRRRRNSRARSIAMMSAHFWRWMVSLEGRLDFKGYRDGCGLGDQRISHKTALNNSLRAIFRQLWTCSLLGRYGKIGIT